VTARPAPHEQDAARPGRRPRRAGSPVVQY
jgi:hypothetical protein